ncbi:hypothetical protein [Lentibacillus kimchii]
MNNSIFVKKMQKALVSWNQCFFYASFNGALMTHIDCYYKNKQMKRFKREMLLVINKAIEFIMIYNVNQFNRAYEGIEASYVLRRLEAGTIAANMINKTDSDLVVATIIQDTLGEREALRIPEDEVSYQVLKQQFNKNIAKLVLALTEDTMTSWSERKLAKINFLKANKSKDIEIATLANDLSKMREMVRKYKVEKEKFYDELGVKKDKRSWEIYSVRELPPDIKETNEYKNLIRLMREMYWYHSLTAKTLQQVQDTKEYREYIALIKEFFEEYLGL